MSTFEFTFTLFGLVLGLALAEVLGGFLRVLKARSAAPREEVTIRVGWHTPLLGVVVALDLISFWLAAWQDRDGIGVEFAPLVFCALLAGIYYAAASLVFPDDPRDWPDLDDWFARHKAQVAAGIFAANLLFSTAEAAVFGTWADSWIGRAWQIFYISLAALLMFARRGWQSLTVLGLMLLVFLNLALRPVLIAAFGNL